MIHKLEPVYTNHLFHPLAEKLISLLQGLRSEALTVSTCYPTWTVHDIVVHLFQTGALRLQNYNWLTFLLHWPTKAWHR